MKFELRKKMSSTIINFIINKFLVNFLEIDATKTNISLIKGAIKFENLKIKREIFKTVNIPYFELVHGIVGMLDIKIKMPFFYDNPIKVKIDKIFVYLKQKDINKLKKEEELHTILEYKKYLLINLEQFQAGIQEMRMQNNKNSNENGFKSLGQEDTPNLPQFVQKIINNILIDISNIIIRFEDDLSYKGIPFSMGIILNHIELLSTKSDFKLPKNPNEVISLKEMNFKVGKVEHLSLFMDLYYYEKEFNYQNMISPEIYGEINEENLKLKNYFKEDFNFYAYCMSELKIHSKKFNSHEYILYQLDLSLKMTINNNFKNKQPIFAMNIDIPQILLNASFKQIQVLLKFIAYINLNSLYQNGISSQYFNEKLSLNEKHNYVDRYEAYFVDKYINKKNIDYPDSMKRIEEKLSHKDIIKMRSYAIKKFNFTKQLEYIGKEIEEEIGAIIKDDNKIKKLNEKREKILKNQEKFLSRMFTDKSYYSLDYIMQNLDVDNRDENLLTIYLKLNILITSLNVYECEKRNNDGKWEFQEKVMTISIYTLFTEIKILKNAILKMLFTLENILITDDRIENLNYNKIIFGDLTEKNKNVLCMIFEINSKFKKSDYYCKIWSERVLNIILNVYTFQYIIFQSVNVFTTTIVLEEYSLYAKDSVLDYIKEGYQNLVSASNFTHTNIELDINLKCPMIIVPIDVFNKNKTQCFLLTSGEIKIKSILPPRVELNPKIDYKNTKDENLVYDIYRVSLYKGKFSTVDNCVEKNNYLGKETEILNNLNLTVDCKILIQPENKNFDNTIISINMNKMVFNLTEFQILLIIEFIGNYIQSGYKIEIDLENFNKGKELEIINMKEQKKILEKIKKENAKKDEEDENEKMDLIPYKEKKKRAAVFYQNFIKSFSPNNYHRISHDINTIHKNKKTVLVEIVLKGVDVILKKNYPGNDTENYLIFDMDELYVECDIAENGSLVVIVSVKDISLRDCDKDENKNFIINKNYQYLIGTEKPKINTRLTSQNTQPTYEDYKDKNFIDYQLLMIGNDLNNIVNVNDLKIIVSLESLLNMYQFSMYYTELYLDKMYQVESWKKSEKERRVALNENESTGNKWEELNEEQFRKNNMNYMFNFGKQDILNNIKCKIKNKNDIFKNIDKFKQYLSAKFNQDLGFERTRRNMTVLVNVYNANIILPINPKNLKEPLYTMNFNLVYNQNTTYIYTDFFTLPSKRIIGTFYEENNSSMNTFVSKFDMDMVYYTGTSRSGDPFTHNLPEERLITNFRMKCLIDSFLVLNSQQNVMSIDVILEPLLFAFGMRQLRKTYNFCFKVWEYYKKIWEKYTPFTTPYETNGKNKKWTLKEIVRKIIIQQKFLRLYKMEKKNIKKKTKGIIVNTNKYNSLIITNLKSDRIGIIFFDNTTIGVKKILLEVKVKKLIGKFILNSKITDKENIINALYEMLTGEELPINKYNRNKLSMYYYIFCATHANYYNILTNKFEPILEHFETSLEMMQVAPFFRAKTYVIINDIINYNLSIDSLIALNTFITKFTQDETTWDIQELIDPVKWRSTFLFTQNSLIDKTRSYDIILQFMNDTGIDLAIFFESNVKNRIRLGPNDIRSFTSDTLYIARGLNRKNNRIDRTNFGVYVYDSFPIKDINYKRTHYKQYKINIEVDTNKYIPIYLSIKVESSYLLHKVSFSSSIAFFNDTNFRIIYILIKNSNLEKNEISILKESKTYIPITWLICQPPNSSIYIKFDQEGETFKVCDHITELFHEPIDNDQNEKSVEYNFKKKFKGNDNPNFNKINNVEKYENENMKNSKYISINYEGQKYVLNFDYFLVQSKNIKNIIEKTKARKEKLEKIKNEELKNNIIDSYIYQMNIPQIKNNSYENNLIPEINYEYIIAVRHSLSIINKLPLTLYFSYNDKFIRIESLGTEDLYDFNIDKIDCKVYIKIKYFEKFYISEKFNLTDIENHQYIDLVNVDDKTCLKCHVIKRPKEKILQKPKNYFLDSKGHSVNTYELIFFVDYIINNRLIIPLWICSEKNKNSNKEEDINSNSQKISPTSLNLISFPDYEYKISIRDENSNWSSSVNLNTIGINSSIKLDNRFNKNESKKLINEIAIIIKTSKLYDFSIIVIFEPKYVIINNLGFDIVYYQENNSLNRENLLKKSDFHLLKYEDNSKNFKVGIYDHTSQMTFYSGYFALEKNEDLDLKIKINPSSPYLPKDSKIFSYDGIEYYILIRIINHTYDHGTNYLLLCHPLFPYLEIVNNLNVPLRITEKSTGNSFIIYNKNHKITNFPFVWENPATYEDKLIFEIYNITEEFSFSVFNQKILELKELNLSLTYSVSTKNKTETRSFKIEQTKIISNYEMDFLHFILRSRSLISTSYSCFIKGFGISVINQEPKEIFYISLYNIKGKYITNIHKSNKGASTTYVVNYLLLVDNFQVDYCLNDSLKVVISPTYQLIPSNEEEIKKFFLNKNFEFPSVIAASVKTKTFKNLITNEELTSFEEIELALEKFEIKLETNEILNLLNIYEEFMKHFDYSSLMDIPSGQDKDKEPLLDIELPIPIKKLMKENENSFRNLINNLTLSSLKFNITLRLDQQIFSLKMQSAPRALLRIMGGLVNLGRITNCPLVFFEQRIEDLYISWYDLSWKIIYNYIKQGMIQIFNVLGSLDIIGNPVNLIQNIKEGIYGFVDQNRTGNREKTDGLGLGKRIAKSFGSLMAGVVGGAFNSLQRLSSTLLVSVQTVLDRDKKYIIEEEQNEPENAFYGIYEGFKGFGIEIGKGIYNLFTDPCKRGTKEGASGFFRGLAKGLFGVILSPIAGILKFVSSLSGGIKNSCFTLIGRKKLKTTRFRHPRIIVEGEEMIHSYDESKAEAKEMLDNLNKKNTGNILYAEDFICGDSGLGNKFCTAILSDKAIYVLYNCDKLIFEEKLDAIYSIEIHFIDNNYIVKLKLKNTKSRGFKVHKYYSKIACELFDLIGLIIEKIKREALLSRKNSGLERGVIGKILQKTEDDIIDESSYGRTLTLNTYYSMNTLKDKVDNNK